MLGANNLPILLPEKLLKIKGTR